MLAASSTKRSTDETPNRLATYLDSRIRWVRQGNLGDFAARAQGVSLTHAPKIVFLDADDCLYPDALARYVRLRDCSLVAPWFDGSRWGFESVHMPRPS